MRDLRHATFVPLQFEHMHSTTTASCVNYHCISIIFRRADFILRLSQKTLRDNRKKKDEKCD